MIHVIKRTATAGVLALGLLVMPFGGAPLAPQASAQTNAQLQAQIQALLAQVQQLQALLGQQGGSVSGLYCNFTFTRDLSIGSTGEDVRNLQRFLNSVPGVQVATTGAGSPGMETAYYGPLTAQAVSAFQSRYSSSVLAPLGLTSPTGYFGASSRAQARTLCTTQPPVQQPDEDDDDEDVEDDLQGGEADIRGFDILNDPRNEEIGEGDEEERVLGFEFDVDNSDISVRRVDVAFEATDETSDEPWDYFEEIHLMHGDDVVASINADDEDDWDERNSSRFSPEATETYQVRFTGLDERVDEGDTAEFYIAVTVRDVVDSADLDQDWHVWIPSNGIRVLDAAGINHYEPSGQSSAVTFTVSEQESGDLTLREANDNPNDSILVVETNNISDEYTVLVGEIEVEDAPITIEDLTITATTSQADGLDSVVRSVTLVIDGEEYRSDDEDDDGTTGTYSFEDIDVELDEDDEVEISIVVEFLRQSGNYDVGDTISFAIYEDDVEAEGDLTGDPAEVEGDLIGNQMTLMLFGSSIESRSTSSSVTNVDTPGADYGTYTIRFDITAVGEDVYIYDSVGTDSTDGIQYRIVGDSFTGSIVDTITSTANDQGDYYRIRRGNTETFTLRVVLNPNNDGFYGIELEVVEINDEASNDETDYTEVTIPNEPEFETDQEFIQG